MTQEEAETWLFETSAAFLSMFRGIHDTNLSLRCFNPQRCIVSTMTIKGVLDQSVSMADVQRAKDRLLDHGLRVEESAVFLNQVTVKSGKASIKLFRNGSVHCTGLQSPMFFAECMARLCSALEVSLVSASAIMININFDCRRSIPLMELQQALGISFDPDCKYPGVRGKIEHENAVASLMAFASGKVILSGSSPDSLRVVYGMLCNKLETIFGTKKNLLFTSTVTKSKGKHMDSYKIHHGYSSRLTMYDLS